MLSNNDISGDLGRYLTPQTTPISTFCIALLFVSLLWRGWTSRLQIWCAGYHSKSQPMDNKLFRKGCGHFT